MLISDPMWLLVTYLLTAARRRARALRAESGDSGGLSLEWIVIVGILGAAAIAAGAVFVAKLKAEEAKIP